MARSAAKVELAFSPKSAIPVFAMQAGAKCKISVPSDGELYPGVFLFFECIATPLPVHKASALFVSLRSPPPPTVYLLETAACCVHVNPH